MNSVTCLDVMSPTKNYTKIEKKDVDRVYVYVNIRRGSVYYRYKCIVPDSTTDTACKQQLAQTEPTQRLPPANQFPQLRVTFFVLVALLRAAATSDAFRPCAPSGPSPTSSFLPTLVPCSRQMCASGRAVSAQMRLP